MFELELSKKSAIRIFLICIALLWVIFTLIPWWANGTNDAMNVLNTGFSSPATALRQDFVAYAKNLCKSDRYCMLYAHVLEKEYAFNYGVSSLFARMLWLRDLAQFGTTAIWTAAVCALISAFIGILVFALIAIRLCEQKIWLLVIFCASSIALFFVPKPRWHLPMTYGTDPLPAVVLVASICLIIAFFNQKLGWPARTFHSINVWMTLHRRNAWLLVLTLIGALVLCRILLRSNDLGTVIILVVIAFALLISCSRGLDWLSAGLIASAMVMIAIAPYHHVIFMLPVPRGQASLIAIPLLLLLLFSPNSRWAFVLPAFLLFHVSIATIVSFALLTTESIVCSIERRVTRLLIASAGTFAGAFMLALHNVSDATAVSTGENEITRLAMVHPQSAFAVTFLGLCFFISSVRLIKREGQSGGAVARALLLIGITIVLFVISALLTANNSLAGMEPHLFVLVHAGSYVAEILFPALLIVLVAAWSRMGDDHREQLTYANSPSIVLLLVGLLTLRIDNQFAPFNPFEQGGAAVALLVAPERMRLRDPRMALLKFDDEKYLLPNDESTDGPLSYLSLLKMRMRSERALIVPSRATILGVGKK